MRKKFITKMKSIIEFFTKRYIINRKSKNRRHKTRISLLTIPYTAMFGNDLRKIEKKNKNLISQDTLLSMFNLSSFATMHRTGILHAGPSIRNVSLGLQCLQKGHTHLTVLGIRAKISIGIRSSEHAGHSMKLLYTIISFLSFSNRQCFTGYVLYLCTDKF